MVVRGMWNTDSFVVVVCKVEAPAGSSPQRRASYPMIVTGPGVQPPTPSHLRDTSTHLDSDASAVRRPQKREKLSFFPNIYYTMVGAPIDWATAAIGFHIRSDTNPPGGSTSRKTWNYLCPFVAECDPLQMKFPDNGDRFGRITIVPTR